MSIATGSVITWSDLTTLMLNSLKSVCCNIDSFASNVPTRLRSGQGQVAVKSLTSSVSGGASAKTNYWYANPSNLITTVTSATVDSEWTTFLSAAGINSRSTKIMQAKDLSLTVGLFQQFMSYHLKPVYSRRQIYNTLETNPGVFQGTKYITGTCTPKYTLTAIEPGNIPQVTDSDITNIINQSIYTPGSNWGMLDYTNNPNLHRCYLS